MAQFIGFHVTGDPKHPRKTTPIATGATRREVVTSAMWRLRVLRLGYLQVQQREDISPEDFDKLTAVLDTHFDKIGFRSARRAPTAERIASPLFPAGA